jgi:hypothetical protein
MVHEQDGEELSRKGLRTSALNEDFWGRLIRTFESRSTFCWQLLHPIPLTPFVTMSIIRRPQFLFSFRPHRQICVMLPHVAACVCVVDLKKTKTKKTKSA